MVTPQSVMTLLSANTGSELNVAVGFHALRLYNNASGSGYNTAVGSLAGDQVTTGIQNTLIGGLAGDALDVGVENVALGYASLTTDTKGNYSTAIGTFALAAQNFTSATDAYNTAVGSMQRERLVTTGVEQHAHRWSCR
jgi:trimeric autotransporter adhesin